MTCLICKSEQNTRKHYFPCDPTPYCLYCCVNELFRKVLGKTRKYSDEAELCDNCIRTVWYLFLKEAHESYSFRNRVLDMITAEEYEKRWNAKGIDIKKELCAPTL